MDNEEALKGNEEPLNACRPLTPLLRTERLPIAI